MTDKPPLIFTAKLGMLAPVNAAARAAVAACVGDVTVQIKRATKNQRRRSLYWIVADLVAGIMNDLHGLDITDAELHDQTRERLGLVTRITLPSGAVIKRLHSTSDAAMQEPERAAYTTKAFALWARWTGVPVETLTAEGRKIEMGRSAV